MSSQFEGLFENDGFDKYSTPRWLMVPHQGYQAVELTRATGLIVKSEAPGIAKVEEVNRKPYQNRMFRIRGVAPGNTCIVAWDPQKRTVAARLEVDVKPRKVVRVAFRYVWDKTGRRTVRNPGDEDRWIERMNVIYTPQTNIEFKKIAAAVVKIDVDLGPVVRHSKNIKGVPADEHDWKWLQSWCYVGADWNVFLVWEFEGDDTPEKDDANAGNEVWGDLCVLQDKLGKKDPGVVLAHEAGHHLGIEDYMDPRHSGLLMYGGNLLDRGTFIPQAHAYYMNPTHPKRK